MFLLWMVGFIFSQLKERLLLNAKWAIFQLYHGENITFKTLDWIFIVLAHWNNSLWVDMLCHSDTLSRFCANQSLLLLFKAVCVVEEQIYQFNCLWFDLTSNPQCTSLEESMITITPPMQLYFQSICVSRWHSI